MCFFCFFCCILPHTSTYSEPENDHFENDYHLPNLHFFWGGGPSSSSRFYTPKKNMANPFTTPFPDRPTDCTFIAYIMHNSPGLGLQISGELIFIGNLRVYLVRHRMGWVVFFRELEGKSQERIGCPKCVYDIHHMCRFVMSTSKTQQPKHIGALCKHVH